MRSKRNRVQVNRQKSSSVSRCDKFPSIARNEWNDGRSIDHVYKRLFYVVAKIIGCGLYIFVVFEKKKKRKKHINSVFKLWETAGAWSARYVAGTIDQNVQPVRSLFPGQMRFIMTPRTRRSLLETK